MFDLATARPIYYGSDNDLRVTVYQDREDKDIWYMTPVPRLRVLEDGLPAFSLTKYLAKDAGISGVCTFEVELWYPPAAKDAAQREIPDIAGWGDFNWVGGDAFFQPGLPDRTEAGLARTPSLFGANVAAFQLELATPEEFNAFLAALQPPRATSPCRIAYQMGVLTQMLAAKAQVKYTASAAIAYERRYEMKRDIWGNREQVLVQTREILRQSGAGDVTVTPGRGASDEVVQLVRDWAWSTLEKQVADAVESARALAKSDQSPVEVTSDFVTNYSEDAIVEWSTEVSTLVESFDEATWAKVYHEVDNRRLVVNFQLAGDYNGDIGPLFTDVVVEVKYPTDQPENTFKLTPNADTTKTFTAVPKGAFTPEYEYRYTVSFPQGAPPYTSGWIKSETTLVTLMPSAFGIRRVMFVGSAVPFGTATEDIREVAVDFFEQPPLGQAPKLQTKRMTANQEGGALVFESTYHVPVTNTYSYRLRYFYNDGRAVVVQPAEQFGSQNADLVLVQNPANKFAVLNLRALVSTTGFASIDVSATYNDKQNSPDRTSSHSWRGWGPLHEKGLYSSAPWDFDAQPNQQTAYFDLNGQVIYGDGSYAELANLKQAYSRGPLVLFDTEKLHSLEIVGELIDWTEVVSVRVNVMQARTSEGEIASEELVRIGSLDELTESATEKRFTNFSSYTLLAPEQGVVSLPMYYVLRSPRDSGTVSFYYNATFVMRVGPPRGIEETEVTNRLQLFLKVPEKALPTSVVHRAEVPVTPVSAPTRAAESA